jgi:hypothetical protein
VVAVWAKAPFEKRPAATSADVPNNSFFMIPLQKFLLSRT